MIRKITRGWRPGGLLRYLMGPGRFNEHVDPRVLDTWDGVPERQPARTGPGEFDLRGLLAGLTNPAVAGCVRLVEPPPGADGRVPAGPVWHCSLRNAAGDRVLSDEEWREVARDLLHRTGIAPRGDSGACRWVMVRHADDHVHVAAVLVREDTRRRFFPRNDYLRAGETCSWAEQAYGLERTGPVDRTAVPAARRAEIEKASRLQVGEPSRVALRRAVRVAAVTAQDPEAFFARLRAAGVRVWQRRDEDGTLVGYAVAQPGDQTAEGKPVWYGGRSLARDLALPQLQRRWASAPAPPPQLPPEPTEHATVGRAERGAALANATSAAHTAAASLAAGDGDGGGIVHAAGDLLTALGQVIPERATSTALREQLRGVAEVYDRAARTPGVGQPLVWGQSAQALRTAAWQLAAVRVIAVGGSDAAGAVLLLSALATLAAEVAAYHEARARHVQAAAARRAHRELVASRPADTRPGRGEAPVRPGVARLARRHPEPASDTLDRPAATRPPPQPGPPQPPPPTPGQTPRPGRTR